MIKKKDNTLSIFKFNDTDVHRKLLREMELADKFKTSFNYLLSKIPTQKLKKDLNKLTWDEGKSYDWVIIEKNGVHVIIRKYQSHFTIYFKYKNRPSDGDEEFDNYYNTRYGCLTFETNRDRVINYDVYIDNNFFDLNQYIDPLFELIKNGDAATIWNPYCFKQKEEKERPNYIEAKIVWDGGDDLSKIDLFVFACEELFSKHLTVFAQTDMLDKIKTIHVGDKIGVYEVTGVITEFSDMYSEPYYHGVGLYLRNTKSSNDKPSFADVYSLSRYYYDSIFV